jgi:hypothetical protein
MTPSLPDEAPLEQEPASEIDPDALRLGGHIPEQKVELACTRERRAGNFIAYIPLVWFQQACALPGKAAVLGAALWYHYRRNGPKPFRLTNAGLKGFGITRQAKYRALDALEAAGLISVRRPGKKSPEITILNPTGV